MESVIRTSYGLGVKNDTSFSSFPLLKTYSSLLRKWLKDFRENIFKQTLIRRQDSPCFSTHTYRSVVQCPHPDFQEFLNIIL